MLRRQALLCLVVWGSIGCTQFRWPESPAEKKEPAPPAGFSVSGINPADASTNVVISSTLTVIFSKAVTVGSVSFNATTGACTGNVQVSSDSFTTCIGVASAWDGAQMQLTLTPAAVLAYNTVYQVKVLTTVQSASAEPLAALYTSAGITTEAVPPLNFVSISPADGTTGAALGTAPQVTFSSQLNTGTATFSATSGACSGSVQMSLDNFTSCIGIVSLGYNGTQTIMTINAAAGLAPKAMYRVRLTTAIVSTAGQALSATYTSTGFTTLGDVWITRAAMPTTARGSGAIIAVNNMVYAIGGNAAGTNEMYNPVTNTWTTRTALGIHRQEFGIATANNKIYVIGGCSSTCSGNITVYEYDTVGNAWTNCGGTCATMPTARYALGAAEVGGFIYAAGGYNGGAFYATVERFDPVGNTWLARAPMANQREGVALASLGGKLYAMGGHWTADFLTYFNPASVEEYDPVGNVWTTLAATVSPGIKPLSVGVIAGKIYSAYGPDTLFREYDQPSNTFTNRATKNANVGSFGGAVANGKFYAINMTTGEVGEYTPP